MAEIGRVAVWRPQNPTRQRQFACDLGRYLGEGDLVEKKIPGQMRLLSPQLFSQSST